MFINSFKLQEVLRFKVDSVREAYIVPGDKNVKFIDLRESILEGKEVDVLTL